MLQSNTELFVLAKGMSCMVCQYNKIKCLSILVYEFTVGWGKKCCN